MSGTSGSLTTITTLSLTVAAANGVTVNMGASFNVHGIFSDGSAVTNNGLDTSSYTYSANQLGTTVTSQGLSFALGAPAQAGAAKLPPGARNRVPGIFTLTPLS